MLDFLYRDAFDRFQLGADEMIHMIFVLAGIESNHEREQPVNPILDVAFSKRPSAHGWFIIKLFAVVTNLQHGLLTIQHEWYVTKGIGGRGLMIM